MVQLLFMKTFEFVIFKFTPKNVRFCMSDKSKYKVECVFWMIISNESFQTIRLKSAWNITDSTTIGMRHPNNSNLDHPYLDYHNWDYPNWDYQRLRLS